MLRIVIEIFFDWKTLFAIFIFTLINTAIVHAANSTDKVIFLNPALENQVFQKNDTENINGNIITTKDIVVAQISFDGQIWHDLPLNRTNDGYSFTYDWMVSGKGRFFILVQARTKEDKIIEGRILGEVYVPPDETETGLQELLTNYQKEQEKKQAKEKQESKKLDPFTSFEFLAEDYLGGFIINDYLSTLPTKQQIEFMMRNTINIFYFIKNYQAGIDIFFLFTLPLLIVVSIGIFLFIYLDFGREFLDWMNYKIRSLYTKKDTRKNAVLFDFKTFFRIPFADVLLENTQNHKNFHLVSDNNGYIYLSKVPDGEYYFSVNKRGFKSHVIEEITNKSFMDRMVAENNVINVAKQTNIALPVECEYDMERKKIYEKVSLFYSPKVWFLSNASSAVTVGFLVLILYIVFINIEISVGFIIYFMFAYLIYHSVVKNKNFWGKIIDYETYFPLTDTKIELWKDNELYLVTWTDFCGNYGFWNLQDGIYEIKVDANYHFVEKDGYYFGSQFALSDNSCQMKKNIILKKITS